MKPEAWRGPEALIIQPHQEPAYYFRFDEWIAEFGEIDTSVSVIET